MDAEQCIKCFYCKKGQCRRNPPVVLVLPGANAPLVCFPAVTADDWCGEYKAVVESERFDNLTSIYQLRMSYRLRRILLRNNVSTVLDVRGLTEADARSFRGLGAESWNDLKRVKEEIERVLGGEEKK